MLIKMDDAYKKLEGAVNRGLGELREEGSLLKKIETNPDMIPVLTESAKRALKRIADAKDNAYIAARTYPIG
jgi:hypothetical protein